MSVDPIAQSAILTDIVVRGPYYSPGLYGEIALLVSETANSIYQEGMIGRSSLGTWNY